MLTNPVLEYMHRHGILAGQVFMRAKRFQLARQLTLEDQKEACAELSAYQVFETIPPHVRRFCDTQL